MTTRLASDGGYLTCFSHEEATKKFRLDDGRDIRKTRTVNLSLEDATNAAGEAAAKKELIRKYFHATYELYEKVFEPLACDKAFTMAPVHRLRHPLIFYLGHTATFYLNKLALAALTTRINPKFEESFAIGVDEMSWDDLNEAHYDWPAVRDVWAYRSLIRERIDEMFDQHELPLPLTFANSSETAAHTFFWGVMMGIEHERIHIETASVHIRELPLSMVKTHAFWAPCTEVGGAAPANELVPIEGADAVVVGRQMDSPGYGWDCDYSDKLKMKAAPLKASKHLVSNAEFSEFVKAGGYAERKYWDEEGWGWVSWKKPAHPWFWVPQGDGAFRLRVQTEEIPLPADWPVEVNNLEARAFCNWKGEQLGKKLRMPTEAEWLHMRDTCMAAAGKTADQWAWDEAPGNINMEHFASSCPVSKFQHGPLFDVVGNVWQHTETPVYPYSGFSVHPLYDDFSMPTFDGRHACMKGGCWVSTGNEATRDARFAFRRHFFQFIGIRYVEGENVNEAARATTGVGMDPAVDLSAQQAFAKHPDGQRNAGDVVAEAALAAFAKHGAGLPRSRAMDLLCGAGLATFRLAAAGFREAIGVDFTARNLQPGFAVRERGMAQYSVVGADGQRSVALFESAKQAPELHATREQAFFYQSDPANLHAHLDAFTLVVAFDVLTKSTSYAPDAILPHMCSRLVPGGVMVVVERKLVAEKVPKLLGEVAAQVGGPAPLPLYFAETAVTGRVEEFEMFVCIRKN